MAKCEICGKGTVMGKTIQHQYGGGWFRKAQKKKRAFKANIQSLKIPFGGTSVRISACTQCLKTHKGLTQTQTVDSVFESSRKETVKA